MTYRSTKSVQTTVQRNTLATEPTRKLQYNVQVSHVSLVAWERGVSREIDTPSVSVHTRQIERSDESDAMSGPYYTPISR